MAGSNDKIAFMKEIISLMIVCLSLISALMSSAAVQFFKDIKIAPWVVILIIAVLFFVAQVILRITCGDEKYNEIKKKIFSTALDYAVIVAVIAGLYFGGKYAVNEYYSQSSESSVKTENTKDVKETSKQDPKVTKAAVAVNKAKDKEHDREKEKDREKQAQKEKDAKKLPAKAAEEKANVKTAKSTESSKETSKKEKADHKESTAKAADSKNAEKNNDKIAENTAQKQNSAPVDANKDAVKPAAVVTDKTQAAETVKPQPAEIIKTQEVAVKPEKAIEDKKATTEAAVSPSQPAVPAKVETAKLAEALKSDEVKISEDKKGVSPAAPAVSNTNVVTSNTNTVTTAPANTAQQSVVINVTGTNEVQGVTVKAQQGTKPAETVPAQANQPASEEAAPKTEVTVDDIDGTSNSVPLAPLNKDNSDSLKSQDQLKDDNIKVQKDFDLKDAGDQLQKAGEKVVKGGKVVLDKTGRGLKKGFEGIKKVFKKDSNNNNNANDNNTNDKPTEEDKIENVITE